jgi:DNA-binding Lrp family transcriptional regulator
VLINVELGAEEEVKKALEQIEGVKEANIVYGVYDLVVKIEAPNIDKIKEIVTWKIRRLERVRSTLTMIVVES